MNKEILKILNSLNDSIKINVEESEDKHLIELKICIPEKICRKYGNIIVNMFNDCISNHAIDLIQEIIGDSISDIEWGELEKSCSSSYFDDKKLIVNLNFCGLIK